VLRGCSHAVGPGLVHCSGWCQRDRVGRTETVPAPPKVPPTEGREAVQELEVCYNCGEPAPYPDLRNHCRLGLFAPGACPSLLCHRAGTLPLITDQIKKSPDFADGFQVFTKNNTGQVPPSVG